MMNSNLVKRNRDYWPFQTLVRWPKIFVTHQKCSSRYWFHTWVSRQTKYLYSRKKLIVNLSKLVKIALNFFGEWKMIQACNRSMIFFEKMIHNNSLHRTMTDFDVIMSFFLRLFSSFSELDHKSSNGLMDLCQKQFILHWLVCELRNIFCQNAEMYQWIPNTLAPSATQKQINLVSFLCLARFLTFHEYSFHMAYFQKNEEATMWTRVLILYIFSTWCMEVTMLQTFAWNVFCDEYSNST